MLSNFTPGQILEKILELDPTYKQKMMDCKHAITFNENNPYHVEDSVWAHAMCVFTSLFQMKNVTYLNYLIALFHDYGKVPARRVNEKNRVTFYGHGEEGTQYTINMCKRLLDLKLISNCDIAPIVSVVSNHMKLYNVNTFKDFYSLGNYDQHMIKLYDKQFLSDVYGSICLKNIEEDILKYNTIIDFTLFEQHLINDIDKIINNTGTTDHWPTVIMYGGIPGSGKDYLAVQNEYTIISLDDIRVDVFEKSGSCNDSSISEKEKYKLAFEYCNRHGIHLDTLLILKIKEEYQKNPDKTIAICNTNTREKNRSRTVSCIKKAFSNEVNIDMEFILVDTNTAINRDQNRRERTVGEDVIKQFTNHISIPTMLEGFRNVTYTSNF